MISCTSFEIRNEIKPKISIVGNQIGLQYNLGNLKVVDQLDDLTNKIFEYIEKHADGDGLTFTLIIRCDNNDGTASKTYFEYYLNGILVEKNTNVVKAKYLLQNYDSIEGFIVHEVNGKTFEEWREDTKKDKMKTNSVDMEIVPDPNQEQTFTTPSKEKDVKI
jgi:hypothetical protein